MSEYLKDRYCTCKTLCVWIPMDGPPRVWSVPPRAYQAYCPTCKIIVNEYIEKDENNALMLTPKVSFAIFKENQNLQAVLKEKDAEIAALKKRFEEIKVVLSRGRDATGCSDEYFRGMYNGIEWCLCCIEDREPNYNHACEKSEEVQVLAKWEARDE